MKKQTILKIAGLAIASMTGSFSFADIVVDGNTTIYTGETIDGVGNNYFSNEALPNYSGDTYANIYDASTITHSSQTFIYFRPNKENMAFTFQNGTTVNDTGNGVYVGYDSASDASLYGEINILSGSSFTTSSNFRVLEGGYKSIVSGKFTANIQGNSSASISTLTVNEFQLNPSDSVGSSFSASINLNSHARVTANSWVRIGTGNNGAGNISVNLTGADNILEAKTFLHIGNGNSGNNSMLYIRGNSATETSKVIANNNVWISASKTAGNTGTSSLALAGNAVFDGRQNLFLGDGGSDGLQSGKAYLEISGSGNTFGVANTLAIGSQNAAGASSTTASGTAETRMTIIGSGSNISVGTLNFLGGVNSNASNPVGGILEFAVHTGGVSQIDVGTVAYFEGVLMLDFSQVTGFLVGGQMDIVLISASNDFSSLFDAWDETAMLSTKLRDSSDSVSLEVIQNGGRYELVASYFSAVPEPSAYAAALGTIAFAFAAYGRKRKN